jgi:hypothetical protein
LELAAEGEHKVLIGELAKTATHYVLRPRLGSWLKLFATLLGTRAAGFPRLDRQ